MFHKIVAPKIIGKWRGHCCSGFLFKKCLHNYFRHKANLFRWPWNCNFAMLIQFYTSNFNGEVCHIKVFFFPWCISFYCLVFKHIVCSRFLEGAFQYRSLRFTLVLLLDIFNFRYTQLLDMFKRQFCSNFNT